MNGTGARFGPRAISAWVPAAAAVTLVATAAVVLVPPLQFAYRSQLAHVTIESMACVIAALLAAVAAMRFRRTSARSDLLLFATLLVLAVTNLAFSLVPTLAGAGGNAFSTWAPASGRFLGALGFLAAAYAGSKPVRRNGPALRLTAMWTLTGLAAIALTVAALAADLPRGVDVIAPAERSGRPDLSGRPLILGLHLAQVLIYAAAAWGFARRQSALGPWIAVAMVVAAGARLNYFLYPSLYSEYVYVGDIMRLSAYLLLLGGLIAQVVNYERAMGELGVLQERRRLSRDLHDGLAQELAFITARTRGIATRFPGEAQEIARSAERALLESRLAISALARPVDEPDDEALRRVACEAVHGALAVEVTVEPGAAPLAAAERDALLRIVAEAARNAARHGGASTVSIALTNGDGRRLRIHDDGCGFESLRPAPDGHFGLCTMRERAEALGGACHIRSSPGQGTEVEVRLP